MYSPNFLVIMWCAGAGETINVAEWSKVGKGDGVGGQRWKMQGTQGEEEAFLCNLEATAGQSNPAFSFLSSFPVGAADS